MNASANKADSSAISRVVQRCTSRAEHPHTVQNVRGYANTSQTRTKNTHADAHFKRIAHTYTLICTTHEAHNQLIKCAKMKGLLSNTRFGQIGSTAPFATHESVYHVLCKESARRRDRTGNRYHPWPIPMRGRVQQQQPHPLMQTMRQWLRWRVRMWCVCFEGKSDPETTPCQ